MDGPGQHYAKSNKPGDERQIPYDFTYMWNLMNKVNLQAKQRQTHRQTAGWEGWGVEGLSKKEKGLMGMGNSVMTVRWGGA